MRHSFDRLCTSVDTCPSILQALSSSVRRSTPSHHRTGMAHNMHSGQAAPSSGVPTTPSPAPYTNSAGGYGGAPPGGYYDQYGQPVAAPPAPAPSYGPPTGAPQYGPPPVAYSQPQFYPPYPQYPPQQQAYYYQPAPAAAAPAQGGYYGAATSATSQNHSGEFASPYPYPPPPVHPMQQQQGYMQPGQGYSPYGAQPQAQQMYAPQAYQPQPQLPQQQQQQQAVPPQMYAAAGAMGQGQAGVAAAAFASADVGNKGHLDVRGFRQALESLGMNIQYDQLLKYFAKADRDQDGHIAEVEFISLYQNDICRMYQP